MNDLSLLSFIPDTVSPAYGLVTHRALQRPLTGVFAMRIIDWKQLKEMQPYSRQHIGRLEKAGKWPQRVTLGNNRIGWVYDEIVAHLEYLANQRNPIDSSY